MKEIQIIYKLTSFIICGFWLHADSAQKTGVKLIPSVAKHEKQLI